MRQFAAASIYVLLAFVSGLLPAAVPARNYAFVATRSSAAASIADVARPALTVLTDREGLPLNSVMTLERDQRGYLWIGTQDGIAVYDSNKLRQVPLPKEALSSYIYDILAASDGSIWFATGEGGVLRYADRNWEIFDSRSGLVSNATRCLLETAAEDGTRTIWVGTRDGLATYNQGVWKSFEEGVLPDPRVRSLQETTDRDGTRSTWIGTYGGVLRLTKGSKEIFHAGTGLPSDIVFAMLETRNTDNDSVLWIGTDGGLAKFEAGRLTTHDLPQKPIRSLIQTVTALGTETLWVGTDDSGLYYFENENWRVLTEKNGIPNNLVFSLAPSGSPDGSVWMANLGAGIARLDRSNWNTINDATGLPNKNIFAIAETVDNALWFGTYGGGVAEFDDGQWSISNESAGLPNNYVQAFFATRNNANESALYVGTDRGLGRFENGRWQKVELGEEKSLNEVWDVIEADEGDGVKSLWVATNGGLVRLKNVERTIFDSKSGLPGDRVRSLLQITSKGKRIILAGTYNGRIGKYEDDQWTELDLRLGSPVARIYDIAEVRIGSSREIWIGTGVGAIRFDPDDPQPEYRLINRVTFPDLPNANIHKILQDKNGSIYLTTNKGVARLTPNGEGGFGLFVFTTDHGLPSNECVSGAGLVDSAGRIWVGTVAGAAMLDLSREVPDDKPKPLHLEAIYVDGEQRILAAGTELPYNENSLTFEYALMNPFRESATRYRTQLVGLEPQPTAWTDSPRRDYTFLPDGTFTFRVWGMDSSGNISGPIEVPFSVRPAWWRTWWAFGVYLTATAAFVALIAFAVYRNRLLRMEEVERVRLRIASDLHDDIGASLSQISILSELLAEKKSVEGPDDRHSLNVIAETSRQLTRSMSDVVWSINPNRDRVRDLVQRMRRFGHDVLSAKDVEFALVAPDLDDDAKIDINIRQQIYLVFKEAVNNAAKHAGASEVTVELRRQSSYFKLRVADNGKGFNGNGNSEGNGLVSMRARAESIGGSLEMRSAKGEGTWILLSVPVKPR